MLGKLLIVDDDAELRAELRNSFEDYEVIEASDSESALRILAHANEIEAVILDVVMPGGNGLDLLLEIKKTNPGIGIIIFTGHSSKDTAIEALKNHADDYMEKPGNINELKEAVGKLLRNKRGELDVSALDLRGKIDRVKRFARDNYHKKLNLKDAAMSVCLSSKYLSRVFKRLTGKGFGDYKLALKINGAKELLENSGYNINQIAQKFSYENTESLIRQFKKITGQTPAGYRQRLRKGTGAQKKLSGSRKS